MRYFLQLSYAGAGFHGWQAQPNACSVQETIEAALSTVLRHSISVTGAGRTDTGVNARKMYAHFDSPENIEDSGKVLTSLNRMVGPAISISRLIPVHDDAHARFDATEREYRYFIIYRKSPFLKDFSWLSSSVLDLELMNEASRLLLETREFSSFAKLHSDTKTNICDVRKAEWNIFENIYNIPGICFTITADRFLRNMVRAVVGTLVDVGLHKLSVGDFRRIIDCRNRCSAGTSMPPQALFLWDVKYPYIS